MTGQVLLEAYEREEDVLVKVIQTVTGPSLQKRVRKGIRIAGNISVRNVNLF